ncbi:hypothetical protein M8C21_023333 [Ambrosia artemisiifolia]|uniref:Cleft lip and palate transmembrane protein 1-like protein n=1 Tax=Ambrosia artemisiifolia TaxID=4212 RepID=A0AAD5GB73_AMBAR|nr:hypothetical protein M8C21_023333 [Ambrosia artemisiifolia]
MVPPAAAVEGGDAGDRQQQQQGPGQMVTGIIRIIVIYYFASKFFSSNKPSSSTFDPALQISNLFHKSQPLDMWFYLSEHEKFNDFGNEEALIWHESNIPYAVWGPVSTRTLSLKYYPSERRHAVKWEYKFPKSSLPEHLKLILALKHNGSLYAHVFFARSGYPADPSDPEYQPLAAFGLKHLHFYVTQGIEEPQADLKDDGPAEYISYWKPNITINLVDDFTKYVLTTFYSTQCRSIDKLIALNDTVTELPLHLEVAPISMTKWQLFLQIDQSFQIHRSYGSMLEGEADELKRVFVEGNPYLLGVTMLVSLLHSVFDFLAFKNDIQFWNKNKSMEGLSAKSVVVSFVCQLIIFLYLLDNDTSWMILASSGIGVCIEFWKIGKAMHIEVDRSGSIPKLKFSDRDTYAGNKTKEYDDLAMKYLSYPARLCIHSCMKPTKAGTRGFSHHLQAVYTCSLKSVAHMPWRQMTYKFLNTIIDDLFAFVIKMPMLHRLSVFRDDVIFLIYLYQRWAYPVDKKRVNEFGFGGEDEDEAATALTAGPSSSAEEKKTN